MGAWACVAADAKPQQHQRYHQYHWQGSSSSSSSSRSSRIRIPLLTTTTFRSHATTTSTSNGNNNSPPTTCRVQLCELLQEVDERPLPERLLHVGVERDCGVVRAEDLDPAAGDPRRHQIDLVEEKNEVLVPRVLLQVALHVAGTRARRVAHVQHLYHHVRGVQHLVPETAQEKQKRRPATRLRAECRQHTTVTAGSI